jgi:hypothetical protein
LDVLKGAVVTCPIFISGFLLWILWHFPSFQWLFLLQQGINLLLLSGDRGFQALGLMGQVHQALICRSGCRWCFNGSHGGKWSK